ncbi:HD domain-containing protein [Sinorhizobium sp. 8-89]|uniref:HD domain-containing protein n=1 Tax=Sinorhizobium sp. 7-81 TaxID=3049087 RepID=UPI0024C28470|nr:HD domain-containing protein [Sinorhizobium sp. 7-81]MDK1386504.1 HD domain-containing protein [Sinorhizobium sp. 7-81]
MLDKLETIAGIRIPDSQMARDATALVRDTETDLLYHHSRRVFLFGALTGERRGLKYDPELLYIGAMFHDMGLIDSYASESERFEVDGANAAKNFLHSYDVSERDIDDVWDSIALHTTPGIPQHKRPVVALVTAGVEMDVLGIAYDDFTGEQRQEVCACHPRGLKFKHGILSAFCYGTIRKPHTTAGNVKADVLEAMDPTFERWNFVDTILNSKWES